MATDVPTFPRPEGKGWWWDGEGWSRVAEEANDLASWWEVTASDDCAKSSAKQREYGSDDLAETGAEMTMLAGWEDATEQQKAELGCAFYMRGKLARAFAAYRRHEMPSDDTHHDFSVYSMMIRRIRAVGYWG